MEAVQILAQQGHIFDSLIQERLLFKSNFAKQRQLLFMETYKEFKWSIV